MASKILIFAFVCLILAPAVFAQDTVRVSLNEFIQRGVKNSGEVDAERQKVNLAENRIHQTQSKRYLPKLELDTQHGIIPGVKSNRSDLDPNEYYLDPNLKNNFNDLALFTRAEVDAVQPIFTWGALNNAVKASKSAAEAAQNKFQITKDQTELRLYDLYQSYLLSLEVQRLLDEAQHQLDQIGKKINVQQNKSDSTHTDSTSSANIDESDVFKFRVFKSEFGIKAAEVKENAKYVQRIWNYVLKAQGKTVYMPKKQFLDPVQNPLKEISYYKDHAVSNRPEIKALNAGIDAAGYGVKAKKALSLPQIFLGLSGSYANTPNRPRQSNPFIINKTNYASASVGFGIRQNLDFFSLNYDVKESKIQQRQAEFSKNAAIDGITLQINEDYKNASVSKIKIEKTDEALVTSKQWVRQEQLDYDLDIGNPKDLIDSIQKELQLKVEYKQSIFNFNKDMAELYNSAALSVTSLQTGYSE